MRSGTNDKRLISEECFKAGQQLEALRALVAFARFQVERAEPLEFMKLQQQWEAMLRLMEEKLALVDESNGQAAYLADTVIPGEETAH